MLLQAACQQPHLPLLLLAPHSRQFEVEQEEATAAADGVEAKSPVLSQQPQANSMEAVSFSSVARQGRDDTKLSFAATCLSLATVNANLGVFSFFQEQTA